MEIVTPDVPPLQANVSTLLLYDFFIAHHGKPFSQKMMEWFLRYTSHPETEKDVPQTIYLLKRAGLAFAPQIVCTFLILLFSLASQATQDFNLPSGRGAHYPIEDVFAFILSQKFTTKDWIYDYDPDRYHISGGDCT